MKNTKLFLSLFAFLTVLVQCRGQKENPNPTKKDAPTSIVTPSPTLLKEATEPPKGVIILKNEYYPQDLQEYQFYDDQGKCVKTMKHEQFPIKNPMLKPPFPLFGKKNTYGYHSDTMPYYPLDSLPKSFKLNWLKGFKQYGLNVKKPSTALTLCGRNNSSEKFISNKNAKYLITAENVNIFGLYSDETPNQRENGNSLLDCSYITVYNNLGQIRSELLVPNRTIEWSCASDNGNFLLCTSWLGFDTGEGYDIIEENGLIMIDMEGKNISKIPLQRNHLSETKYTFFSDHYQIAHDQSVSIYIYPKERTYYSKTYDKAEVRNKLTNTAPMMTYEGIKDDLSTFQKSFY